MKVGGLRHSRLKPLLRDEDEGRGTSAFAAAQEFAGRRRCGVAVNWALVFVCIDATEWSFPVGRSVETLIDARQFNGQFPFDFVIESDIGHAGLACLRKGNPHPVGVAITATREIGDIEQLKVDGLAIR